ncbi:MAG: galactokinase [Clostridia bacterium]|nr:galactokinase [Clostridia bacterium]
MELSKCIEVIKSGGKDSLFAELYGSDEKTLQRQKERYVSALNAFSEIFPGRSDVCVFSAPGRTEIGGNHTDHQRGVVLAGAVNCDVIAVVSFHDDGVIRVKSKEYDFAEINLDNLEITPTDDGTQALVRGIAAAFAKKGVSVSGFDMYSSSDVIRGGGLSSSAAFETLLGTIIDVQYNSGKSTPFEIAKIGHFAENVYFGKSCGLLDQTVCSYGSLVSIDFANSDSPAIEKIGFDMEKCGYSLCITDTKSSHENLTDDYVAIRSEMKSVAEFFGKDVLSEVDEAEFYAKIPELKNTVSDRAILRSIHFFDETKRAKYESDALKAGDVNRFLTLVNESGRSSGALLQNLYSTKTPENQSIPLALALSEKILCGSGAVRVHGGGFAGTILAFVPFDKANEYSKTMESVFGDGSCHRMKIRQSGGTVFIR